MNSSHSNLESATTRLAAAQKNIALYAIEANRDPKSITLIAVSKNHPAAKIISLFEESGHRDFGENYFQELSQKRHLIKSDQIRWHFIGQLQSNKIKNIVEICDSIHSLSSLRHAQRIAEAAEACGKSPFKVFLAVNLANESGKSGCNLSDIKQLAQEISGIPQLTIEGIMAVPPRSIQDPQDQEPLGPLPDFYKTLQALSKEIGQHKLSLGMSGDLRLAIHAGSTHVRIGTDIFGPRPPQNAHP